MEQTQSGFLSRMVSKIDGSFFGWKFVADSPCGQYKAGGYFFQAKGAWWYVEQAIWQDGSPIPLTRPRELWSPTAEQLSRWNRGMTDPIWRKALSILCDAKASGASVNLALETIPDTPIATDDLVLVHRGDRFPLPAVRGRIIPMTLDMMEAVRRHVDTTGRHDSIVEITPPGYEFCLYDVMDVIIDRRGWGLRRKVWRPILYVVKPLKPSSVQTIRARSTEGAIFELLAEVGGTMPIEKLPTPEAVR